MSRRMKQAVYGIFYLIVLGAIVTGIYFLFLKPPPPPPGSNMPSTLRPISTIGAVGVFSPLAGHASVLVQLGNANPDYAVLSFDYAVTLYSLGGSTTVATFEGTSFMYADETKYLILPNEPVSGAASSADIAISNVQWVSASQMGAAPQFAFTNIENVAGTNGLVTVGGDITDRDISSFSNIVVVAVFKDAAGTPVGASQTELDALTPGETQNFSISYPLVPNEDISATEIEAYAARN
jgi:hypothetical protein